MGTTTITTQHGCDQAVGVGGTPETPREFVPESKYCSSESQSEQKEKMPPDQGNIHVGLTTSSFVCDKMITSQEDLKRFPCTAPPTHPQFPVAAEQWTQPTLLVRLSPSRGRFIILCLLTSLLLGCTVLRLLYYNAIHRNAVCSVSVEPSRPQVAPYFTSITVPTVGDPMDEEATLVSGGAARGEKLHFSRTKRQLPQCIIIGVRKCGTRALLEFLNMHPRIQKAAVEVHFFDDDTRYSMGLEWYRRRMPYSFPEQITVEKSPAYFITPTVPERIKAMNSSIKLLLIVREPVTRTVSDYTQIHSNKMSKGKPHETFETLALTPSGEVNTQYKAVQISLYAQYLQFWFDVFSREQIHIVDGDQLIEDPFPELQKIEDFLGLDHRISRENFYFNRTKGFFCLRNETTEKCLGDTKGRKHPSISPEVIQKLRQFFHPHNQKFYEMIGRNLGWPTE